MSGRLWCSRPYNVVPTDISAFPKTSSRLRQQFNTLGPSIQALQHHPDLHKPAPPSQHGGYPRGRLGLEVVTWQDSSLRRTQSCCPLIPHRSTRRGVQAQRKDSLPSWSTHAHTHRRQTTGSFLQPMAQLAVPRMAALNSNSVRLACRGNAWI